MILIIYSITTGQIYSEIEDGQDYLIFYQNYPQEFKDDLATLSVDKFPEHLKDYRIINNKFERIPDQEISEIKKYGRVLTEEERLLKTLKPTHEEVGKAVKIIDVLDILQDVGLIELADTALIDTKLIDAYTSLSLFGAYVLSESDRKGINQKLVPTKYKIEVSAKVNERANKGLEMKNK